MTKINYSGPAPWKALSLIVFLSLFLVSRVTASQSRKERITERLSWIQTSTKIHREDDAIARGSGGEKLEPNVIAANTSDVTALLAFRNCIRSDPTGALANWTVENLQPCSTWKGVKCSAAGDVTGIRLPDLGLTGTITRLIGNLTHLRELDLSGNNLQGRIPTELSKCQRLSLLDLNHNSLLEPGELFPELFLLPKLETLWLGYVNISGPLPEVTACPSLRDLRIQGTVVSGAIPSSWSRCRNLQALFLSDNQLNGSIPATLSELQDLKYLLLDDNSFTGSVPSSLRNCRNLMALLLDNNRLNGSIPGALGELHQLQILSLQNNTFTGHIPSELGSLTKLTWLAINGNLLTGNIPPSIGLLRELQILFLHDNKLTGSIPAFLGNCSSLTDLYLGSTEPGHNNFTGAIPEEFGSLDNLVVLYLMFQPRLTGPVPGFLSRCSSLQRVYFRGCSFTSIAPEIWSMKSLRMIFLASNKVTGELPPEVGNCTNLAWLDLQENNLSGTIPAQFSNLTNLQGLILDSNRFTGPIPDLGRCSSLALIVLSSNNFTGDIPNSFSSLSLLETVVVTENNLTSSAADMMSILGPCTKLKTIMVGKNQIHGALQLNFTNWPNLTYFSVAYNKLTGAIPSSFGSRNSSLIYVDFSHNGFTGGFPTQVDSSHLSDVRLLRLSHNELNGTIPSWLGNLKRLQLLDLSNNKLIGVIPHNVGNLDGLKVPPTGNRISSDAIFTLSHELHVISIERHGNFTWEWIYAVTNATTYLDLSANELEGDIPHEIAGLVGLKTLNLANNKLQGDIWPGIFQNLKNLEALDLSQNHLTGPIPTTVSSSLSRFNVSFNDLSGPIPTSNQFDSFTDISSYLPGNPGLCGAIIHRPCVGGPGGGRGSEIADYISMTGFGIGAAMGFFMVTLTSYTWPPARRFVFGTKPQAPVSAYGLFNARF